MQEYKICILIEFISKRCADIKCIVFGMHENTEVSFKGIICLKGQCTQITKIKDLFTHLCWYLAMQIVSVSLEERKSTGRSVGSPE